MTNFPKFAGSDVHIFALRIDSIDTPERLLEFAEMLSDAERKKAERFRTQKLATRFVASHAMLRKALGACLQESPADLKISTDTKGRPYLLDHPDIDFNLSHTNGLSVAAICHDIIGVDVERLRDNIDAKAVSRKVLSARERESIRSGVPASKTPFFDYWTIKEAYAKAVGTGLRIDFSTIDVSLGEALSVNLEGVLDDQKHWTFQLYRWLDYRLAVAVRRTGSKPLAIRFIEVNSDLEPSGTLAMDRMYATSQAETWLQHERHYRSARVPEY